jgi:hypothetical protein
MFLKQESFHSNKLKTPNYRLRTAISSFQHYNIQNTNKRKINYRHEPPHCTSKHVRQYEHQLCLFLHEPKSIFKKGKEKNFAYKRFTLQERPPLWRRAATAGAHLPNAAVKPSGFVSVLPSTGGSPTLDTAKYAKT